MSILLLAILIFAGGVGMTLFGTAIYINEEIKPALEEIEDSEVTLKEITKEAE